MVKNMEFIMAYNFDKELEIRDLRNGDWLWVQKIILEDKKLTPADYRVYSGLASFINEKRHDQTVYPSVNEISKRTTLSSRQIKLSTKKLEKLGYIKKLTGQEGNRTVYVLLKVSSAKSAPPEVVQNLHQSSAKFSKSGANDRHELGSNKNKNKNINNNKGKYSSLKDITEKDLREIAKRYDVKVSFVRLQLEKLANYCEAKGRKYKNYKPALRNFVLGSSGNGVKPFRKEKIQFKDNLPDKIISSKRLDEIKKKAFEKIGRLDKNKQVVVKS